MKYNVQISVEWPHKHNKGRMVVCDYVVTADDIEEAWAVAMTQAENEQAMGIFPPGELER